VGATDIYAVGYFANAGTSGEQLALILHFNGISWSIIKSPVKGIAQQLNGTFALPDTTDVWVAGAASTNGTDPESGFLQVPLTLVFFAPGA
jgi:hypothetical protein